MSKSAQEKKGARPVIRAIHKDGTADKWVEDAVLWSNDGDGAYELSGKILGKSVYGFVVAPEGHDPFVSFKTKVGDGYQQIATMNAQNDRKDGGEVYFDTLSIRVTDLVSGEKSTIYARITAEMSGELHTKLGFTSPRVERPKREEVQDQSQDDDHGMGAF